MGSPLASYLQMTLRVFGQYRAWHALQGDVHAVREVLEALRQVGQPGTGGRQVRGVDLRQVAQADHFGTGTGTRDDGFHLVRGQVLAFIDQNQTLLEAATSNVVEGFELQRHLAEDVIDTAMGVFVIHVQRFEVIGDSAEPRLHLSASVPGRKPIS